MTNFTEYHNRSNEAAFKEGWILAVTAIVSDRKPRRGGHLTLADNSIKTGGNLLPSKSKIGDYIRDYRPQYLRYSWSQFSNKMHTIHSTLSYLQIILRFHNFSNQRSSRIKLMISKSGSNAWELEGCNHPSVTQLSGSSHQLLHRKHTGYFEVYLPV